MLLTGSWKEQKTWAKNEQLYRSFAEIQLLSGIILCLPCDHAQMKTELQSEVETAQRIHTAYVVICKA